MLAAGGATNAAMTHSSSAVFLNASIKPNIPALTAG